MTAKKLVVVLWLCLLSTSLVRGDDWPQWRGPQRDGVWRETGIVDKLPKELKVKWRVPIGAGYAGPAVCKGKVYVADRLLGQGERNPDNPFDRRNATKGMERVLCLDERTGATIWKREYPCAYKISYAAGPRATPTLDGDKLYFAGAMGDFHCLNALTGDVIWKKNFLKEYGTMMNTWGMSSAPLVFEDNVIAVVGGKDNAGLVAFNKETGKEAWRALKFDDFGYCAPEIIEAANTKQLIFWSPIAVHSINPRTGALYWEQPFAVGAQMSIASPIFDGEKLFVSGFYCGPFMIKVAKDMPAAWPLWKGKGTGELPKQTDGLHAVMCTPFYVGDYIYGVCSFGELRCLEAKTGKRIWSTDKATGTARWSNAFLVRNQDRFFLFNEHGELITAKLTPDGYEETSRANLVKADNPDAKMGRGKRLVVWTHPAFANKCVFARNDHEIVCVDLASSK